AAPSDNLQALVRTVNDRLKGSTPISFEYRDNASVGNTPSLVITLDWQRDFHTGAPVQFNFSLPTGSSSAAGVQGSGSVALEIGGEIHVGLVVPLAAGSGPQSATDLEILDDSAVGVTLDASIDDATLTTTLG